MSDWIAVALSLMVLGAAPAAAQDSVAMLHRMEARLDSLRVLAEGADRAAYDATVTDTVMVGAIRVATALRFRPMVQAAAAGAWRSVTAQIGDVATQVDSLPIIVFGGVGAEVPKTLDLQELVRGFERMTLQAIWRAQAPNLVAWSAGGSSTEQVNLDDLALVAREMVATPARGTVACLKGDAAACAVLLDFGVGSDTLDAWYAPEVWPGLAQRYTSWLRPEDLAARSRCIDAVEHQACRDFLQLSRVPPPVGPVGRRYLVNLALKAGGPGALGRLLAGEDVPIEARLAVASGLPTDTLLVRWASAIRKAAPSSPAPSAPDTLLVLGWCVTLLGMAVGGGRWR